MNYFLFLDLASSPSSSFSLRLVFTAESFCLTDDVGVRLFYSVENTGRLEESQDKLAGEFMSSRMLTRHV